MTTTRQRTEPDVAPNGCRWCGREHRVHALEWGAVVGYHRWAEPTDGQRMRRMRDRKIAR